MKLSDPDKVKTFPKSLKAIILEDQVSTISGGDLKLGTDFSSSMGYGTQVPFTVFFKKKGDDSASKKYENVEWHKHHPLKNESAKFQKEVYILVIAIDGKPVEHFVAQMSVYGISATAFSKVAGTDPRLCAMTIEGPFISVKHKFGTGLVPDFKIAPLDQKVPALMALYSEAVGVYQEKIDPFVADILKRGSTTAASDQEADVDDFVDDMPEDGFTELKEEPVEKPKEDLPF